MVGVRGDQVAAAAGEEQAVRVGRDGELYPPAISAQQPAAAGRHALASFQAFLFDADGTLVHGRKALPGAVEGVRALAAAGREVAVITNNSLRGPRALYRICRAEGFPFTPRQVLSAVTTAVHTIARECPGARVLVVGTRWLKHEAARAGLQVVEDEAAAEYVLQGADRAISYEKITRATRAIRRGARWITVNTDHGTVEDGLFFPGSGMITGALAAAAQRQPDLIIGKPSPLILLEGLRALGLDRARTLYVGDSLSTDRPAARAAGLPIALVLTGTATAEDVARAADPPDFVVEDVATLARLALDG